MKELNVFMDGTLCGTLKQSGSGDLRFEYDDAYLIFPDPTPLSLSMPLAFREHTKKAVLPFFDGLITDNEMARTAMARRLNANPRNPFALLEHMGADVAGALQILPPGEAPTDAKGDGGLRVLSNEEVRDELEAVLDEYQDGKSLEIRSGRFSLAGAQAKTALVLQSDGRWAAPLGSTPTTHILKPASGDFRRIDVVEHLTMRAARHLGLPAAQTELTKFGNIRTFVTQRYDRMQVDGAWHRLHQEDLCQALSVPAIKKYQRDHGGPGVAEAARLFAGLPLRKDRTDAARAFYSWLVFNVALECTDAHAKNFSLMLHGQKVSAAPLYDLVTYAPYRKDGETTYSSMKVGGEYRFSAIGPAQFMKAAKTLRVDLAWAADEIERVRSGAVEAFETARREMRGLDPATRDFADDVVESIASLPFLRGQ